MKRKLNTSVSEMCITVKNYSFRIYQLDDGTKTILAEDFERFYTEILSQPKTPENIELVKMVMERVAEFI